MAGSPRVRALGWYSKGRGCLMGLLAKSPLGGGPELWQDLGPSCLLLVNHRSHVGVAQGSFLQVLLHGEPVQRETLGLSRWGLNSTVAGPTGNMVVDLEGHPCGARWRPRVPGQGCGKSTHSIRASSSLAPTVDIPCHQQFLRPLNSLLLFQCRALCGSLFPETRSESLIFPTGPGFWALCP